MSDDRFGLQLLAGWQLAQEQADAASRAEREARDARQALAWSELQTRHAMWPENRKTEAPPPDLMKLRDQLRSAQEMCRGAQLRLNLAIEAGDRGEQHCADIRRRLGALDEIERKHAGTLAMVLRAGAGYQPTPALIEARAARPGAERDAVAADQACAELAADISRAQREADSATAAVNAAALAVMSAQARTIADEITAHERRAGELYRGLKPISENWFGSRQGEPGGPVPMDAVVRAVFGKPPRLSATDNVPPALSAAMAADAAGAWKTFFDALSADPDAVFDPVAETA